MAPLNNFVTDNDHEGTSRSITNAFTPRHLSIVENYVAIHQILQVIHSHFGEFFSQLALHSLYYGFIVVGPGEVIKL